MLLLLVLPDIAEEDRLLARARAGDGAALRAIYDLYFSPLYQFVRLRVRDAALAEDIVSEVFLILMRSLRDKNAPRSSLRGWLFKVGRSQMARYYRRDHGLPIETLEEWLSSPDDPEAHVIDTLNAQEARAILALLPLEQQEVLLLRIGSGLSLKETADIMGKRVSAIKSLQHRALAQVRKLAARRQVTHG